MKVKILKRNKAFSSLPQGSGVKRTFTFCKTIESIETFLDSCAKLVVGACAFRIMSSGREWLLLQTDRKILKFTYQGIFRQRIRVRVNCGRELKRSVLCLAPDTI